jgi:hypothetical protein
LLTDILSDRLMHEITGNWNYVITKFLNILVDTTGVTLATQTTLLFNTFPNKASQNICAVYRLSETRKQKRPFKRRVSQIHMVRCDDDYDTYRSKALI